MSFHEPEASLSSAVADFHRARNQAALKELLARLTGDSVQLLSYDDVRKTLRLQGGVERGVQDIPLAAIVGSVGRYADFTRDFLPRRDVEPQRWARVKLAASGLAGLPPIDVYQIGEIYFVKDGNHRVSVARQLGATHIQAYVTQVNTRISITKDDRPDDLILKAEYSQFLEETQLDLLRPQANLSVTIPGQYPVLLEHIAIHRYYMGLDFKRDISYQEAVTHWYDTIYMPVIEILRARGILRHFPSRTETDLYLWIAEHRAQLEHELGWPVRPEYAASHLVDEHSPGRNRLINTLGRWIKVILPEKLESGPPPGQWHAETLPAENASTLFQDVLVPVNGREDGWFALEQAIVLSQREHSNLHGLHVVAVEGEESTEAYAHVVRDEFERRCQAAGVSGRLIVTSGEVVDQTCQRARTVDVVTVNLSYPPAPQMLARLSSGFRDLIQRSPRPILATPQTVSELSRAFLAYDGSPKAQEALFIATYLASAWKIPLVVGSILGEGRVGAQTIQQARDYLEAHDVQAQYYLESGPIAETILKLSLAENCDMLILGGYGLNPLLEVVLGSEVDHVLRQSCKPMLICQ